VRARVPVIFTAHSLPERIRTWGDAYPTQLAETVAGVIAVLGPHPHRFAYQSAALTKEPWLGPDVGATLDALVADGIRAVVVAPIGFVCEHVEILYDIDVELAALRGDLVVERGANIGWYDGPTLLAALEEIDVADEASEL